MNILERERQNKVLRVKRSNVPIARERERNELDPLADLLDMICYVARVDCCRSAIDRLAT